MKIGAILLISAVAALTGWGAEPAVFDIPRLDKINVDGAAGDWAANGFRVDAMVDALQKLGAPVRFTLYPDAEHDLWTRADATEELYTWLLQQRRPPPTK